MAYLALCYHYLRPVKSQDPFPRILGTSMEEFHRHVDCLASRYAMISPREAWENSYQDLPASDDLGVLLTFDDGLAEHYDVAHALAARGIHAWFFIPTCIIQDQLPANPTIIHFAIAKYGIQRFLDLYHAAIAAQGSAAETSAIRFHPGRDDPWETIRRIKTQVNYEWQPVQARAVLLDIFQRSLLRDDPDVLSKMHLSAHQIGEMIRLGHSIGVHSHSHVSIAATTLDQDQFSREVVAPQRYLEHQFGIAVKALSYPFGDRQDCLSWEALLQRTHLFDLAFTVEPIVNTHETSPFELGRYMPMGHETAEILLTNVQRMSQPSIAS